MHARARARPGMPDKKPRFDGQPCANPECGETLSSTWYGKGRFCAKRACKRMAGVAGVPPPPQEKAEKPPAPPSEYGKDWAPLWDRLHKPAKIIKVQHAMILYVMMLELLHARVLGDAAELLSTLMNEFDHLASLCAQSGLELLRLLPDRADHRLRFARRMAKLAHPANGKGLLVEFVAEAIAQGRHDDACDELFEALQMCPAEHPCNHDGDLHGYLGVAMHARLRARLGLAGALHADPMPFELPRPWLQEREAAGGSSQSVASQGAASQAAASPMLVDEGDVEAAASQREREASSALGEIRAEAERAVLHLRRALEKRPDATLFACCLAQLLAFVGDVDAASEALGAAATAGASCAAAADLWLHWLQRHAPNDAAARAAATERLLSLDAGSARGLAELEALTRGATHAPLGPAAVLELAGAAAELRPRDPRGWRQLGRLLAGAVASGSHRSAVIEWWTARADWWPEACLNAPDVQAAASGVRPSAELVEARDACLRALVEAIRAAASGGGEEVAHLLGETEAVLGLAPLLASR